MAEHGFDASTAKQTRYNLRGSATISSEKLPTMSKDGPPAAKQTRYDLRGSYRVVALPEPEPKRKLPNKKNLMDLNDYCLLDLFDHLRLFELRSISQVNVRLSDLAMRYVRIKSRCNVQPNGSFDFKTSDGQWMTSQAVQLCLTIMGHQIYSLKFTGPYLNIYSNIFWNYSYNQNWRMKEHCSELKSVTLENLYSKREIVLDMFSGLEELRVNNVNVGNFTIIQILENNSTLKKLSIVNGRQTSTFFFDKLFRLQDLEEFEFKKFLQIRKVIDLSYLLVLKKLKVFKFGFAETTYSALDLLNGFVKNGIAIEHLDLENGCIADGSAEAIARLKTIKILKLNKMNGLLEAHVIHIAKELTLLEEIHVRTVANISQNGIHEIVNYAKRLSCFKIDAIGVELCPEIYRKILTAIHDRPEQIKLELWIYGNDLPFSLLDQTPNERWLVVQQLNRKSNDLFEDLTPQWQQFISNNELHLKQISDNNSEGGNEDESDTEDEHTGGDSDSSTYAVANDEMDSEDDDLESDDASGSEDPSESEDALESENESDSENDFAQSEIEDSSNEDSSDESATDYLSE